MLSAFRYTTLEAISLSFSISYQGSSIIIATGIWTNEQNLEIPLELPMGKNRRRCIPFGGRSKLIYFT